jgi:hypothetical protein
MPYLNWKQSSLEQEVVPHVASELAPGASQDMARDKMSLTLKFSASELEEFLPRLEEVFAAGSSGELRLDMPANWLSFWKLREGESRLLIAHPQADEWVTTVALTAEHAALVLGRMRGLKAGQSVVVGELAPTGNVSNVELTLVHR